MVADDAVMLLRARAVGRRGMQRSGCHRFAVAIAVGPRQFASSLASSAGLRRHLALSTRSLRSRALPSAAPAPGASSRRLLAAAIQALPASAAAVTSASIRAPRSAASDWPRPSSAASPSAAGQPRRSIGPQRQRQRASAVGGPSRQPVSGLTAAGLGSGLSGRSGLGVGQQQRQPRPQPWPHSPHRARLATDRYLWAQPYMTAERATIEHAASKLRVSFVFFMASRLSSF